MFFNYLFADVVSIDPFDEVKFLGYIIAIIFVIVAICTSVVLIKKSIEKHDYKKSTDSDPSITNQNN